MRIDIAFSPCPNDTFIFHAMVHHYIKTGSFSFTPHIDDIETLNHDAFKCSFHITKLSFLAYMYLHDRYTLLDAGAALGYGCGPLLVAKSKDIPLSKSRIAIPGTYTTAHLLLRLWYPDLRNIEITRFDDILPGIKSGKYDAGVIIHEGRFVYPDYGCVQIVDLGKWWEAETALPIPLGCIAIRKDPLICDLKGDIERIIRDSIQYAFDNRDVSRDYIKAHAQELDDEVIDQHIALYVNDFSLSLGAKGRKAIEVLKEMALCREIL